MALPQINAQDFSSKVSQGTVLVKYSAKWCQPCKVFGPILEQYSQESGAAVYDLDVDDNPSKVDEYGIQSVPTTQVWINGQLRDTLVGVRPLARLKKELESYAQ